MRSDIKRVTAQFNFDSKTWQGRYTKAILQVSFLFLFFMKLDLKILKILRNQIPVIHRDDSTSWLSWIYSQSCSANLINVTHYIDRINVRWSSLWIQKTFDSTQNPFTYKTFSKLGKEGILHNFIRCICINPTGNIENFLFEFGNVSRKLTNTKTTD